MTKAVSLRRFWACFAGLLGAWIAHGIVSAANAEIPLVEGHRSREACADRDPLRRAYFGDLHVHTVFSLDASTMGTRNRPADAYRFARGERLGVQPYDAAGEALRHLQLSRPLDFAAVTDHAELLGEWNICNTPGLPGHGSAVCRIYRRWPRLAFFWMNYQASRAVRHGFCGEGAAHCLQAARLPWAETVAAAEAAYDRSSACQFTSFVAYEWTGGAGSGNNFHRNVIFANDVVPELPISFIDTPELTDFWKRLEVECIQGGRGCDVLVIPHNSNLSAGKMFRSELPDGSPIGVEEASARARNEVLVEMMQHKGESECMLGIGTEDELCNFENLKMGNFSGRFFPALAKPPVPRQFVRSVLKEGLMLDQQLGVNPFKFGFIASTDTHLALAGAVAEDADFPGHGGAGLPPGAELPRGLPESLDFNPGGLAVLWAEENSRSALFAAMRRREAYGTSGPRIELRFFGGWDYPKGMCASKRFVEIGYQRGVPMGSDLPAPTLERPRRERPAPVGETAAPGPPGMGGPRFAVSALSDPGSAAAPGTPLQRIQIVKGWVEDGATHERVFEVAGTPNNGASVELDSCERKGDGFDSLCALWQDPDFDLTQPTFYYARVLENPVCRWSQRLCVANRVNCDDPASVSEGFEPCCSPEHQRVIQERAWSSPIWFRPES